MKSLAICLLLSLAAFHNVAGQEETTTLAPQGEVTTTTSTSAAKDATGGSETEVPLPVEPSPTDGTNSTTEGANTEPKPDSTEEKPKEAEEKKEEEEAGDKEGEEVPKELGEQEAGAPGVTPQEPPRIIFVQQHIRDPLTGVMYTRQVPLVPSNFLRPMPYQPGVRRAQPELPPPQESSQFDPLRQYSEAQKKRQFFQDMLLSQLEKFQREIEPMMSREENVTEKNDIEDVMGVVGELKRTLEAHQIFNISEIMNNWKEGKLTGTEGNLQQGESNNSEQQRPPMPPMAMVPPSFSRPPPSPPLTLRTLILVPHTRVMPPSAPPQSTYNPFNPSMSRHIPVLHIRRPFQSTYEGEPQIQPRSNNNKPQEHLEPQPSNEEYSNPNEIFGY